MACTFCATGQCIKNKCLLCVCESIFSLFASCATSVYSENVWWLYVYIFPNISTQAHDDLWKWLTRSKEKLCIETALSKSGWLPAISPPGNWGSPPENWGFPPGTPSEPGIPREFVKQVVLLQLWLQISHFRNLYIKIDWAIFCLSHQLAELDLYVILYFLAKRNNTPLPLSLCCVAVCWMCYHMQLQWAKFTVRR